MCAVCISSARIARLAHTVRYAAELINVLRARLYVCMYSTEATEA